MFNERLQKNTLISLVLHILILCILLGLGSSMHVLVPSRSDGLEVMLVNSADIAPVETKLTPDSNANQIRTLDTSAEVNLKQDKKIQQSVKVVQPKTEQKVETPKPAVAKPKSKKTTNAQLDDLLGQIASTKTKGHSRGAAAGGNINGTSDTKNMLNNYADLVIARVRPFVVIPDGMDSSSGSAVVEVTLLPNMQVYAVSLIKSSGNNEYDNNVQQAINKVQVFPPLPDGASFADFRKLRLTFRPE